MLNERGIRAITPSGFNSPSGPYFSLTVTPCNSPEGSPTRSRSPEREELATNSKLLHLENRARRSIKLLERVEQLSLENIIVEKTSPSSSRISPLAIYTSNMYARSSPMSQFMHFQQLMEKRNEVEEPTRPKIERKRQKSRRSIARGSVGQRRDLGTVNSRSETNKAESCESQSEPSLVEGFVGSISSLLFGRKGGLL